MTKEVDPQERVQALRSVDRSLPPSSIPSPSPDEILHVDTIVDPKTQKRVVLWDDILQVFEDAVQARHKSRVVPFLKGDDLRILEPRRIAAIPNTVLDVIVADPSTDTEVASPANGPKETASVPPLREEIEDRTTLVMQTQETTSNSAIRRNPVYGLENTAMDNYSHIDHPAFAPPPRGPQAILDNQGPAINDLPALPHSSNDRGLSSRASQSEGATINASKDMNLVQLCISASQGDKVSQVALGDKYSHGEGVQQNYQAAMDWYLQAANQGDANAQRKVGLLYDGGLGVPQNYSTAMEWFLKAASQGDPSAQFNIGLLYINGQGVSQDFSAAMDWFRMAANQGLAYAQNSVGAMYNAGQGVPQDFAQAMEWFRKAGYQGEAVAQCNIGAMYNNGQGVPQDFAKAMQWYRLAADQGDADSQYNIGTMYTLSQGVTKNDSEARKWFQKAADQGHQMSQQWLNLSASESDKQIVGKTIKKKGFLSRVFK